MAATVIAGPEATEIINAAEAYWHGLITKLEYRQLALLARAKAAARG